MDKLKENFLKALDSLVSDENMIAIVIDGDNKYYLKKTNYFIEIRSDESSTWLAEIRRPLPGDTQYREFLLNKYLDLVANSKPEHFDVLKEAN